MENIHGTSLSSQINNWTGIQESLRRRLVLEDDFKWRVPTHEDGSEENSIAETLKYVGGVDLSFLKDDPSIACAGLVVVDLDNFNVVYDDFSVVQLQIPYIPGFLAFREAPILLELLEKVKHDAPLFYPQMPEVWISYECEQLLMVDGNGLLHPQGFGLACHLGVIANLPTIGIGKNLHHVDGLVQSEVRILLEAKENCSKDLVTLTGYSGSTWGAAMRSTESSLKPIFVSIGHRISLDTALKAVKMTCKYRVPEPIRQADIRSRDYLQKHPWVAKIVQMQ